jgi:hypothetical protein
MTNMLGRKRISCQKINSFD